MYVCMYVCTVKKKENRGKKKKANVTLAALLRIDLNYLVHRTFAY